MRFFLLFFTILFWSFELLAQVDLGRTAIYSNDWTASIFVHNRGMGGKLNFSKRINTNVWRQLNLEFLNMKHPKEFKVRSLGFNNASGSYTYGKLNSLYLLRLGFGLKKNLSSKFYKNTLGISAYVNAGAAFGILKPVYLEIFYPSPDQSTGIFVTERYDPIKHNIQSNIFSNASFSKGLDELELRVGTYIKGGFIFNFSDYNNYIKAIEVGSTLDFFATDIPIMALVENKKVFSTVFIGVSFGSKWNR
jgi:hypothetical protein